MTEKLKVIISVSGGVAYIEQTPPDVDVYILDLDDGEKECLSCGMTLGMGTETCPYCGADQSMPEA